MNGKINAKQVSKPKSGNSSCTGGGHPQRLKLNKNNKNENPDPVLKHSRSSISRKSTAPVKKVPNVHSATILPPRADPQVVWRQLVQEKQRNKILQLEVERLRKSLEVYKKTAKEKSIELEAKNKLINKLIEDKTRIESASDVMEDDIDIDNLLHANLGEVDLSDLLNMTDSVFPSDLSSLDLTNLESDQARLSLSPSSLAMATNTTYVVEEEELLQFPNREGSSEVEENVEMKGVVGRLVGQKRSFQSFQDKPQKVSPIKIIKDDDQYQLVSRKHTTTSSRSSNLTPMKKMKLSTMTNQFPCPVTKCLSCPHCDKQFPLGGQWKLTRHISTDHHTKMTYSCECCYKKFSCQSILTAHSEWHKLTCPWQCEECGYRLSDLRNYIKHARTDHQATSLSKARTLLKLIFD